MTIKIKSLMALIANLLIVLILTNSIPVYANSAEPPALVIIVADAPSDLAVNVYFDVTGKFEEGHKSTNAIESQFKFFGRDLPENTTYTFEVSYGDERFEVTLDKPIHTYHATYTLNLEKRTLIPGETLMRNVILVGLRVSLTILIEGAIFWLLGFRKRRSWIILLIMNLLTQGILNLMLSTNPVSASYVIFSLIFGELFVFIVEWIVVIGFVNEHSQANRFATVTLANAASVVLGGYLISILPI